MKGIIVLAFLLPLTFSSSFAKEKKSTTTKQVMNEILQSFVNLIPYASDEMKWKDPNAKAYIQGNLTKIADAFKEAKHLSSINQPGFRPSYEVVREHVEATVDAFNSDHKIFARTRLKATTQLCMSCHTQLSQTKASETFGALGKLTRNDFASDFEYAEFLFLIRDYNKAIRYYEREIDARIAKNNSLKRVQNSDASKYLDFTIEQSLKRMLTIYTKINYDPSKAMLFIEKYKNAHAFSSGLKGEIENWIKDLKIWQTAKYVGKITNEKELESFIKKYLEKFEDQPAVAGENDVTLLVANGALYSFLNRFPKSESGAQVLYWLAETDKVLNQSYFFSLSDIYLRVCVMKYSKSPYAPKCYKSYEESIYFGYSGSAGTNVPKEELDKLEKLKSYLPKKN